MNNGKEEAAGAGGGIRNKYKKHKGGPADNADDLKKAFVDGIKNRKDGSAGKSNRQKNEGGVQSKTQITITKTEITSREKDGISKTKSSANFSNNSKNKKGAEMSISRVTEVSTQENKGGRARTKEKDSNNAANSQGNQDSKSRRGNKDGNNQNSSKDKASGQRITKTTEISSTTTTNQQSQGNRRGNIRDSNNPNSQNQGKPGGKPNETPNQPGRGGRGNNPNQNKDQQNPNQRLRGQPNQSNRDKSNQNNKNPQPNERGRGNKPNNQANPKGDQKSTPNLRAKSATQNANDKPSNRNQKDNKKNRPLSTVPQSPDSNMPRNNTVRILIDQTGRIPKKEYVLNVRKLDTIKDNRRHKQTYNDAIEGEDKPISTTFNHNVIVVKNVTKDLRTVADVGDNEKIIHRYSYNYVPGIPNTGTHSIDESGKIQKKERIVSPRKNDVIVTEKKPHKMNYNQAEVVVGERIPIPTGDNNVLRGKKPNIPKGGDRNKPNEQHRGRNNNQNDSKSNRNRSSANNNKNNKDSKLEISTVNRTTNRNKSESSNRGKQNDGNNKTETSKTERTTSRRSGANGRVTEETTKVTKTTTTTETKTTRGESKSNRNKTENNEDSTAVTSVKKVMRFRKKE